MVLLPKYVESLDPAFLDYYAKETPPWGPLGFVTYKRTYSRWIDEERTRKEEWHETIRRAVEGVLRFGPFTKDDAESLYHYTWSLKCMFSGRGLWQLGTKYVDKWGQDSLQNCFSGDTRVLTSQGVRTLEELSAETHAGLEPELLVYTEDLGAQWIQAPVKMFGEQRLYRVHLSDGSVVRATGNHEWLMFSNGKINKKKITTDEISSKLEEGKRVQLPLQFAEIPDAFCERGFAHGFTFGDGWHPTNVNCSMVAFFGDKDEVFDVVAQFGEATTYKVKDQRVRAVTHLPSAWKDLPTEEQRRNEAYVLGFILGLIAADGSVRPKQVRLHNKDRRVLDQVRDMARGVGLRVRDPYLDRLVSPFDGTEKPCYGISISSWNMLDEHFLRSSQRENFVPSRTPQSVQVMHIERDGVEQTYCAQVPDEHNFTLANGVVTGNCWHVAVSDPVRAFCFLFDELMMGGGVGFNIHPQHVYEMPKVKFNPKIERRSGHDVDLIVADNREGWVRLLKRVLRRFFFSGKDLTYSADCIRDKGAPIKGFGGTASGPEILCQGIEKIRTILSARYGRKLRPIDCLDICNVIGSIVVAGNVRRSAQIALGHYNDVEFLNAKNWALGEVPAHRAMSNNSILADTVEEANPLVWEGYAGNGEAYGWVNLNNCRRYGRLIDGSDYGNDPRVVGVNPCGEITLESFESCNLSDIYLPNCVNDEEFHRAAALLYKVTKVISTIPAIHPETNAVLEQNRRLGIGVTGYLQDTKRVGKHESFNSVYKMLRDLDHDFSKELGVNESIKLTTVKPSGTVSLLPGVTPGVHPSYAEHYIRRIRMASGDPLVKLCREHGYKVEPQVQLDGSRDLNTMVVEFPVAVPEGTICAKDVSAIDQLEHAKFLQTWWSDNSVSCTVYYRKEELPEIKTWMKENYADSVKAISFLLHSEHGFQQAPYEEISENQFNELTAKVRPITKIENDGQWEVDDGGCTTGACPVK